VTDLPICCVVTGVPANVAAATLTATYNDLEAVKELFAANKGQIAGVILEPVVGNAGFITPTKEFLQVRKWLAMLASLHP
jgi:glutamate-1-semialdehyde aminotransferase